MSLFGSKSPIGAFAKELAEKLARRYPPELDQNPGRRPSVKRLTRIVEDTCNEAVEFRQQQRLGWLGKARLGNAFRWELVERGYSKEFVDFATEAIVVYVSRKAPTEAPSPTSSGEGS
jgi:hypothetical protein